MKKYIFKIWEPVKSTIFWFINFSKIEKITLYKKPLSNWSKLQYKLYWDSCNYYDIDFWKVLFKPTEKEFGKFYY